MNFTFLQDQVVSSVASKLIDYGVLGIVVLILLAVVWTMWKAQQRQHDANQQRIAVLEEQQRKYLVEDRAEMMKMLEKVDATVANNTAVLNQLLLHRA